MLKVMLCGAADTERLREEFTRTVLAFGGEPWHFVSGHILHLNNAQSSWQENSAYTVERADLCVFAIVERYGEITWKTELRRALAAGKPFLVLCLNETRQKYLTLRTAISDRSAITDPNERELVDLLSELESEQLQMTIASFGYGTFGEELRHQLTALFTLLLDQQEKRNRRAAAARLMHLPARLGMADLVALTELALDETEEKTSRKRAIRALADRRAAGEDTVRALLASTEEGVQRLTVQLLPDLMADDEADRDFFDHCVEIANRSDDVGLLRRLIPVLTQMDVAAALQSFESLDVTEIGTRRRLADALEAAEDEIRQAGLTAEAAAVLDRCLTPTSEKGWLARCRELRDRLRPPDPT
jgi:hypothetical protein